MGHSVECRWRMVQTIRPRDHSAKSLSTTVTSISIVATLLDRSASSIHCKPGPRHNRNRRFRDVTEVHFHRSRTKLGIDVQQLRG
jgi:hypothetical protein